MLELPDGAEIRQVDPVNQRVLIHFVNPGQLS